MAMLDIEIEEECFRMYNGMKNRKVKVINFRLSPDNRQVLVDPSSMKYSYMKKNVFETWASDLPDDQCLYSLYDFDILIGMDGMSSTRRNKIGFCVWAPPKSRIKDRMILASAKDNLRRAIEGIQVEWQLNGRDDLDVGEFVKTLGNQPGIRHAGRIIGFEGESVKFWETWKSHPRDLNQLHGVDCSKIPDYYDKMKDELQGSEIIDHQRSENNKRNRREISGSVPSVGRDGVPKFSRTMSGGEVDRREKAKVGTGASYSRYKSSSSTSVPRRTSITRTSGSFKSTNKYGSHSGINGSSSNLTTNSTTTSIATITNSVQPKSSVVSYRDGVKVITEEYVVEETETKTKKKKKKKDKEKEKLLDAEEKRLKKEKKKAKKAAKKEAKEYAANLAFQTNEEGSSILARIQQMNLN